MSSGHRVRVGVRVRPLLGREVASGCVNCILHPRDNQILIGSNRLFTYDHVFPVETSQETLYDTALKPLIDPFMEGYNVTVIAYGQTGSGKTYTMGSGDDGKSSINETSLDPVDGCIPRFIQDMFQKLESSKNSKVHVSFLEIYGEEIRDLLTMESGNSIRENYVIRENQNGVYVQGLSEIEIANRRDALEQLKIGSFHRATASTSMNNDSSRSHAIYTVRVEQEIVESEEKNKENGSDEVENNVTTIISKLTFVDLAGSERLKRTQSEGMRLKEGVNINLGLLALGNVINALGNENRRKDSNSQFIPYRSSKLTRLLQDALGGNSQTLFLACVSPAEDSIGETMNTLKYANRARNIKNMAIKNVDARSAEILYLRNLVTVLQQELIKEKFIDKQNNEALEEVCKRQDVLDYIKEIRQSVQQEGYEAVDLSFRLESNLEEKNQKITTRIIQDVPKSSSQPLKEEENITLEDLNEVINTLENLMALESKDAEFDNEQGIINAEITQTDAVLNTKLAKLKVLQEKLSTFHETQERFNYLKEEIYQLESEHCALQQRNHPSTTHNQKEILDNPQRTDRILSLREKIKELRKDLQRQLVLLTIAEREKKRLHELESSVKTLKTQKVQLMKELKEKGLAHHRFIREKNKEIQTLRKSNRKQMKTKSVLELQNRRKELQLQNRGRILTRVSEKLKDTEKKMIRLLENRVCWGENSRTKDTSRKKNTEHTRSEGFKNVRAALLENMNRTIGCKEVESKLSNELKKRAELLKTLLDLMNQRECIMSEIIQENNVLKNHDGEISNSDKESQLTRLEEVDASLEATEIQISVCDTQIQEFTETLSCSNTEKDKSNYTVDVKKSISQLNHPEETFQLIDDILHELEETKFSQQGRFEKVLSLETSLAQVIEEKDQLSERSNQLHLFYERQNEVLRTKYEEDLVQFLKKSVGLDDLNGEETNLLCDSDIDENYSNIFRKEIQTLQKKIQEYDEQNESLNQSQIDIESMNSELKKRVQRLEDDNIMLERSLQESQSRERKAVIAMQSCNVIWEELGVEHEERSSKLDSMTEVLTKQCEIELEKLEEKKKALLKKISILNEELELIEACLGIERDIPEIFHKISLYKKEKFLQDKRQEYECLVSDRFSNIHKCLEKIMALFNEIQPKQTDVDIKSDENMLKTVLFLIEESTSSQLYECYFQSNRSPWDLVVNEKLNLTKERQDQFNSILRTMVLIKGNRLKINEQIDKSAEDYMSILEISQEDWNLLIPHSSTKISNDDSYGLLSWETLKQKEEMNMYCKKLKEEREKIMNIFQNAYNEVCFLVQSNDPSFVSPDPDIIDMENLGLLNVFKKYKAIQQVYCHMMSQRNNHILNMNLLFEEFEFNSMDCEQFILRVCNLNEEDEETFEASKILKIDSADSLKQIIQKYWNNSNNNEEKKDERNEEISWINEFNPVEMSQWHSDFIENMMKNLFQQLNKCIEEYNLIKYIFELCKNQFTALRKLHKLLNEIQKYGKKIAEFEERASQSNRLFKGSSLRLLEEERFRKAAAKRYPMLIRALREEVEGWKSKATALDTSLLGTEMYNLLMDTLDANTELMHLNLTTVETNAKIKRCQTPSISISMSQSNSEPNTGKRIKNSIAANRRTKRNLMSSYDTEEMNEDQISPRSDS